MGWSCRAEAGDTMRAWVDACTNVSGQSNVFKSRGVEYFWEEDHVEHSDGAITGAIWRITGATGTPNSCHRVSLFRINPDGTVARAPAFLKAIRGDERSRGYGVGSGGAL